MTSSDDITAWIDGVRQGDSFAAQQLWSAYFDKLTRVASEQLAGTRKTAHDEEDVALSAFKSFCLAAQDGRFEKLVDRESLWPLLVSITAHKSVDAIRFENRKKRGGTGGSDESSRGVGVRIDGDFSAEEFFDSGPSAEFATELAEQFHLLLSELDATGDPQLRKIAIEKMAGGSSSEIAAKLDCARRTVERKMQLIRRVLSDQLSDASPARESVDE